MVRSTTTYHCDKCRKPYVDYDEARACEGRHIVDEAVSRVEARLKEIFKDVTPVKARLK